MERQAGNFWDWRGSESPVVAGMERRDMEVTSGRVMSWAAWQARCAVERQGMSGRGAASRGMVRQRRRDKVRRGGFGWDRHGKARFGRQGLSWLGVDCSVRDRTGLAGKVWPGQERLGLAR